MRRTAALIRVLDSNPRTGDVCIRSRNVTRKERLQHLRLPTAAVLPKFRGLQFCQLTFAPAVTHPDQVTKLLLGEESVLSPSRLLSGTFCAYIAIALAKLVWDFRFLAAGSATAVGTDL